MRFRMFGPLVAALLVAAGLAQGQTTDSVAAAVLVDFGDGTFLWADVSLPATATAFNATQAAAEQHGLVLTVSYFGGEPFVADIGDRRPAYPDYWHFLLWDGGRWVAADAGAGSVNVTDGDAFAWYLARDDPCCGFSYVGPFPLPTPTQRNPSVSFRGSLDNLGTASGAGPRSPRVSWSADTSAFEITGTAAGAGGSLVVPTWTGLRSYDLATGALRWANPTVRGASSPALFNDTILVGGVDGGLHAVDFASGQERWNVTLQPDPRFTGISSSPKVYKDVVIVGTFNESGGPGAVVAVDLYTRQVRWSVPTGSVHLSSPAIVSDVVYVGIAGMWNEATLTFSPPYGVAAFDAVSGQPRFFRETNGSVSSSPAVTGGIVFYTTRSGYLDAVDAETGALVWTREIGASVSSPAVAPSPVTYGGRTVDGLVAVGSGALGSVGAVWGFDLSGNLLWSVQVNGPVQASPTIADDIVYVASNTARGTVYAIRAKDVASAIVLWSFTPVPEEYILSSPVVIDGRLVVASDNGFVYVFQDAPPTDGIDLTPFVVVVGLVIVAAVAPIAVAAVMLWRRTRGPP